MRDPLAPAELTRRLNDVFGPRALEGGGLFHAHQPALRFELSRSGTRIDLFAQAFDRAREILEYLFRDSISLVAVLQFPGHAPLIRARPTLRQLRDCGIQLLRPRACWTDAWDDDEFGPDSNTSIAFRAEPAALTRFAWAAVSRDLGIAPGPRALVRIADPERGILALPYDDRGMDVIGPNREVLAAAYARFHGYLLDYDREVMRGFFEPADD